MLEIEIGDFSFIKPYETETMLGKENLDLFTIFIYKIPFVRTH
jgi:hypothetical protein